MIVYGKYIPFKKDGPDASGGNLPGIGSIGGDVSSGGAAADDPNAVPEYRIVVTGQDIPDRPPPPAVSPLAPIVSVLDSITKDAIEFYAKVGTALAVGLTVNERIVERQVASTVAPGEVVYIQTRLTSFLSLFGVPVYDEISRDENGIYHSRYVVEDGLPPE